MSTKNEYMTVRDPDEEIRSMLDVLRVAEAGGEGIQMSRTEMLRLALARLVEEVKKKQQVKPKK